MFKYVQTSGTVNIKTPMVDNFSDIKITTKQFADHIEEHCEYPNGLVFDRFQYSDRIEYISNKKLIVLDDFSIAFEQ